MIRADAAALRPSGIPACGPFDTLRMLTFILPLVALAALAGAIAAVRRRRAAGTGAPVLMELRDRILRLGPSDFGVEPDGQEPFVAVMDITFPDAVASLVTASTGDASLYFSTGGGVIGGVGHEAVRTAAIAFVRAAGRDAALLAPTTDLGHPSPGHVRFLARRADGVHAATATEEELQSGINPLSRMYMAGQEVITQLRLVTEAR